jgi:hypothetical protein
MIAITSRKTKVQEKNSMLYGFALNSIYVVVMR